MQTERRFQFRKLRWKVVAALSTALLIFLLVLALAPSDNIWIETKRNLEERGELLDWEKVIPPEVAPEDNFFDHRVAASLLPIKGQPVPDNPLGVGTPQLPPSSFHLGVPFALTYLKRLPRERNGTNELSLIQLHDWFAQWDESFAQLREAGKRPQARLPGDYSLPWEAPIPNFVIARQVAQLLGSRAKVHLLLGDSVSAFEDLETLSVIMRSFDVQPSTLVTAMIHVAIAGLYLETVDEGYRSHLWAEPEMKMIVVKLREINLLAVVEQGIRSERIGVLRTLEALANRKRDPLYARSLDALSSDNWTVERIAVRFSPPGWVRRGQAHYAQLIQGYLDAIDSSERRMDQAQLASANSAVVNLQASRSPKDVLIRYVTPSFSKAAATVTRNQSEADRLALALALELFRARHGAYPSSLQQLVPNFIPSLPNDLYTGQSATYEVQTTGYKIQLSKVAFSHATNSLAGVE